VNNFALLDHVSVVFENGLMILTGETGAGKSIFIDAMGAILGEKVDGSIVRHGAEKAVIEAIFSTDESYEVQDLLKKLDLWDESGDLIIRREVHQSGRTRSFANDTPINLNTLEDIGNFLVDLHGQHEHQSLLKVSEHGRFLDLFGKLTDDVLAVGQVFQELNQLQHKHNALREKQATVLQQRDLLAFQLEEIERINPQSGEEDDLFREEKILQNSEKIFQLSNQVYQNLYDDRNSVYDRLSEAVSALEELGQIDARIQKLGSECESARIIVEDTAKYLQNYLNSTEFEPDRLESIRERLGELSGLKKKFGGSLEAVLRVQENLKQELNSMENLDQELAEVAGQLQQKKLVYAEQALALSKKRIEAAARLQKEIETHLVELGMAQAKIEIAVSRLPDAAGFVVVAGECYKATRNGMDFVEFFLAANPGTPPKPLVKVASGGEISRVMLALKLAQADADRLPVMVFDEVDSGVSGRIARAVGRNLRKLANSHQIICITHLPQIASLGHTHFLVEKFFENEETRTVIRKIEKDERILAVAKLLGGETISEAHLESAKELINDA
jgi:DNA repair protein RecN (Recombination protein N)